MCDAGMKTMAVLFDGTKCTKLSGENPTTNADFSVANENTDDGLTITYNGGDNNIQLTMEIDCSPGDLFANNKLDVKDANTLVASFKGTPGCKYD